MSELFPEHLPFSESTLQSAQTRIIILKTLEQIAKDLQLNEDERNQIFFCTSGPSIIEFLHFFFENLFQNNRAQLNKLLYRIDLPEKKTSELKNLTIEGKIQALSRMTLERAYQKVCFREYFKERDSRGGNF